LTVTFGSAVGGSATLNEAGSIGNYTLNGNVTAFGNESLSGSVHLVDTTSSVQLGSTSVTPGPYVFGPTQPFATLPQFNITANVIAADMNNDGIPDLVYMLNGSVLVALGNGNGTFQTPLSSTGISGGQNIAVADFNNDGILDVAISGRINNFAVLLGNGNGTFQAAATTFLSANDWVAAGDFNHDGNMDLAFIINNNFVELYLGNGNGTFAVGGTQNVTGSPSSISAGDLNADGYADLVVTGGTVLTVIMNNAGTLQTPVTYPAVPIQGFATIVDLNGDGKEDLAIGAETSATVVLGRGDGTFGPASSYATGMNPHQVAVGDFNNDGIADLATVNEGDCTLSFLQGNGDGTYKSQSEIVLQSTCSTPGIFITSADFNGDGLADFAVSGEVLLLGLDEQTGSFSTSGVSVSGSGSHNVVAQYNDTMRGLITSPSVALAAIPPPVSSGAVVPSQSALVFVPSEISTIAGNGTLGSIGDGGPGTAAELNQPFGSALDALGNLYIADSNNNKIRHWNHSTGIITTFAGTGVAGSSPDGGLAANTTMNGPRGLYVDQAGDVYYTDFGDSCVRKINATTTQVSTVAGVCNSAGFSGDGGLATSAQLSSPAAVVFDTAGNMFIADFSNFCVRKVTASNGLISTVAGECGTQGFSGDGGSATSALMSSAKYIALDKAGDLYIADTSNNRIRVVSVTNGSINTIAGTGTAAYSGDGGSPTLATLNAPAGIAFDGLGNLYIADQANNVLRFINQTTGTISTIAGNGTAGYSGDGGPATAALLNGDKGVTVSPTGTVFIADQANNAIRSVGPSGVLAFGSQSVFSTSASATQTVANYGNVTLAFSSAPVASGDFAIAPGNTCGVVSLAAGATCSLSLSFTPSVVGARSGSVTFSDNASPSTQTLVLSGTGTQVASTVLLSGSPDPSTFGSAVAFTATVPAQATGIVTFMDGGSTLGTGTVSGGSASFSISSLNAGTHSITAVYGGDTNFTGSTSTVLSQTVNHASSTTTLALSPTTPTVGKTATLTATVTPGATGTVTFKNGAAVLGSGTISGGVATFSTTSLVVGPHSFTAIYAGDSNFNASTSAVLNRTINPEVMLNVSDPNPTFGESITITALLPPGATGTVNFSDESGPLGSATVSGAQASISISSLPAGSHSLSAAYSGDSNNPAASSANLFITVNQAAVTLAVTSSIQPSLYGDIITFRATVTTGATGSITFTDGGTTLGTASIVSGVATFTPSLFVAGAHTVTATYSGDSNFF
jgi:Bacterial Ig-like domain (group 3)/FG-GAP-like repeat